ncbi:hypothetical protein [Aquincola tertiaricarbonis]|uniref:hypothetical protein n=1 Tax=Aquincola tertiaricarbonis TaxID=391953 RepID=UPI000614E186|nr:hypothetical protein [Aquincola tertiaricarbonis]
MVEGLQLQLYMGAVIAEPAPRALIEALVSVQVTEATGSQSGFQLVFTAAGSGALMRELLPAGFFDAPRRVIVAVTLNGEREILIDGVITRHELTASNEPGKTQLTVTGLDVSQMMDLIDFSGFPWPALTVEGRVALMIAKYAMYGIVPLVVPSVLVAVPNPLERINGQRGTDLAYIKRLASEVGYTFHVTPGPEVGMSLAYWGPEIKVGEVQPALTVNMDQHSNVDALTLGFDGIQKTLFVFFIQQPDSRVPIPIPVPDIGPLNPPLGPRMPVPLSYTKLDMASPEGEDDSTARLDAVTAAMRGLARASQKADVISGSGSLRVTRYGRVLRARKLVGVRGAGLTHDGLYFVKSVTHSIKPGDYTQNFRLTRNALQSFTQALPV